MANQDSMDIIKANQERKEWQSKPKRPDDKEKFARYMMEAWTFATGHGDTMEELLKEFDWQMRKKLEKPKRPVSQLREKALAVLNLAPASTGDFAKALHALSAALDAEINEGEEK